MRCVSCDCMLTSGEMGRKSPVTGDDYLLCRGCLKAANLLSPQEAQTVVEEESTGTESPQDEYFEEDYAE